MANWCPNDKAHFEVSSSGQITPDGAVGKVLIQLLKSEPIQTVVEIGTWNGRGSTTCILNALQEKQDVVFLSLECNREKHAYAIKHLQSLVTKETSIVWGTILRDNEITNLESIFPEYRINSEFQRWHKLDIENMKACPYVFDSVPETIDFLLLDGGEFTTYFEFLKLVSRCTNYIALDDVHASKCKKIRQLLIENSNWNEIAYIPERNGFSLFKRK
jgi:hypothetical protein